MKSDWQYWNIVKTPLIPISTLADDIIEEEETTDEMMDTNKETVDVQHQTKQTSATQNHLDIDNDFNLTSSDKSSMPEVDSLEFSMKLPNFDAESNPWDLVPDQPAINLQQTSTTTTQTNQQQQQKSSLEIISTKPNSESTTNCLWPLTMKNNSADFSSKNLDNNGQNLMDDPFDADWVSLALNQTNNIDRQQPL